MIYNWKGEMQLKKILIAEKRMNIYNVGSSLIVHGSSMVEQTTVNRSVEGSSPSRGVFY